MHKSYQQAIKFDSRLTFYSQTFKSNIFIAKNPRLLYIPYISNYSISIGFCRIILHISPSYYIFAEIACYNAITYLIKGVCLFSCTVKPPILTCAQR